MGTTPRGGAGGSTSGAAGQAGGAPARSPFAAAEVIGFDVRTDAYSTSTLVDADGDGNLDLAWIASDPAVEGQSLAISHYDRDAHRFGAPVVSAMGATGGLGTATVFADVNGDHRPDAIVARGGFPTPAPGIAGELNVLLARSTGGYTVLPSIAFGDPDSLSPSLAVSDLNGDGKPDLVCTVRSTTGASLFVFIGAGDGTFGRPTGYDAAYAGPPAVVDVNRDGRPDVIVPNGGVAVFINKGAGKLAAPVSTPGDAYGITAIDLNGDGQVELISTPTEGFPGKGVKVFWNEGGKFAPPATYLEGTVTSMAVADLDKDALPDLVVGITNWPGDDTTTTGDGLYVLINKKNGFQAPVPYLVGASVSALAAGDVNGDGRTDVAVTLGTVFEGEGHVSVLLGKADGSFASPIDLAGAGLVDRIADVDGDGDNDILAQSGTVMFVNDSGGTFPRPPATLFFGDDHPRFVRTLDLEGDGKLDLVYATDATGTAIGAGDGHFQLRPPFADITSAGAPALGDIDGDGQLDVALPFGDAAGSVAVALNDGLGGFKPSVTYPTGPYVVGAVVADLDGDHKGDLAVATAGALSVLLNDGSSKFRPSVSYPTGDTPLALAAGDIDGDGARDVVVVSRAATHVFRNRGDGTFAPPENHAPGGQAIAFADLTGDGRPDIVIGAKGELVVYAVNVDGTLAPSVAVAGPDIEEDISTLVAGDLDGDGAPEVIALHPTDFTFLATVFSAGGSGHVTTRVTYSLPASSDLALGDADGDHRVDLLVVEKDRITVIPHVP